MRGFIFASRFCLALLLIVPAFAEQSEPADLVGQMTTSANLTIPDPNHTHTPDTQIISDYQRGIDNMNRGDYILAISRFNMVVEQKPDLARPWHDLGTCYLKMAQQNELLLAYQQVLDDNAENSPSVDQALWLDKAAQAFRRVIGLQSDHTEAWQHLATCYEMSNQPDKALAAYRQLQQLEPENTAARRYLNTIKTIRNGYAADRIDDQLRLGHRFYQMGLVQEAMKTFTAVTTQEPANRTARYNQAVIYFNRNQYPKAISLYRELVFQHPDWLDAHFNLGLCYYHCNRLHNAVQAYRQVLQLDPQHLQAHYQLTMTYLALGWNDQAIKSCKTLRRLDRPLADTLFDLILEFRSQNEL